MAEIQGRSRPVKLLGALLFGAGSLLIVVALFMAAIDAYAASHYSGLSGTYTLRGLLADIGFSVPGPSGSGAGDWLLSQSANACLLIAGLALAFLGGTLLRRGSGRRRPAA